MLNPTTSGEVGSGGKTMGRLHAARARQVARRALQYRAWYLAPTTAAVPPASVITDSRLQQREQRRQLRRAQAGFFDTAAPIEARAAA